ncbi:MAG TPA: aldo/keto reductase [Acidimicrobiales bacterium]|nr:aldo/keto reductase [Acidimicrobiales bacterium]
MMRTRKIGTLEVSVVGLGCNNFGGRLDEARTAAVVHEALDAGITFFDTADIYGGTKSEEYLGRALGARRDEVVLATKFGMAVDDDHKGAKPDYVHRALDDSLRRLGTDRVDLYQLHAPDPTTPIGDTLAALDEEVRAGRVREIGCSNFSVEQLREAAAAVAPGAAAFVSVQNQYSLLHRQPELDVLPECRRTGLAFVPYFPLAAGVLTGKYRLGQAPPEGARLAGVQPNQGLLADANLEAVERLEAIAARHGRTMVELAIAWVAAQDPVASVIAGATAPEQVRANVAAADWVLGDDDVAEISAAVPPPAGA